MTPELSAVEVANEVRMRSIDHKGLFLLVEADSDGRILQRTFKLQDVAIITSFGAENVREAIAILDKDSFRNTLGIIDRDYNFIVQIPPRTPNIILTDDRDIDVTLFLSSALEHVINELASKPKLKAAGGINGIRSKILEQLVTLTKLRVLSASRSGSLSFKDIDFSKFVERRTLELSTTSLLGHLRGKSPKNSAISHKDISDAEELWPLLSIQVPDAVRGHDLFEMLAIGLRTLWGNFSTSRVTRESLETSCRLACPLELIRNSLFGQRIVDWFFARGGAV